MVEETPSSEQMESRTAVQVGPPRQQQQQQNYHKTPAAISIPYSHRRMKAVKEQVSRHDRDLWHTQSSVDVKHCAQYC